MECKEVWSERGQMCLPRQEHVCDVWPDIAQDFLTAEEDPHWPQDADGPAKCVRHLAFE